MSISRSFFDFALEHDRNWSAVVATNDRVLRSGCSGYCFSHEQMDDPQDLWMFDYRGLDACDAARNMVAIALFHVKPVELRDSSLR